MRYDLKTSTVVPYMAKSLEADAQGVVWTLKLRDGVKFSDGEPLNADAVLFNWDRIKDPATLSASAGAVVGVTWEKVDDLTVKITLKTSNFQFATTLISQLGSIGSPKAIKAAGKDVGDHPVGAGPFTLKHWVRGNQIEYQANHGYWDKPRPYLDGLVIKQVLSDDQRLNAWKVKQVDVIYAQQSFMIKGATDGNLGDVTQIPIAGGSGLGFNLKNPVMQDEGLRMAMLHAIDDAQIIKSLFPLDSVADAFLPSTNPNRSNAAGLYPAFDLKEAQRLFDDYLKRTGKTNETVTMVSYGDIPLNQAASEALAAQINEIKGLRFKLEPVDTATLVTRLSRGDFQTIQGTNTVPFMDALYDLYHTGGAQNFFGYNNATVNKALDEARTTKDPAAQTKAYQVATGELSKNPPLRMYRWARMSVVSQHDVHGIVATPTYALGGVYWDGVWLDR
jgi:peptide/nickel transport system substrate-binding protein